jgi:effector-binding domain-containing protein
MKLLKLLLKIGVIVLAIIGLLGLFAKKNYTITRTLDIKAPMQLVHDQVRYFKNFPQWSPWHELDRNMKTTMSGTDGEPGAVYTWDGNEKVGKGKQTITGVAADRVEMNVELSEFGSVWKLQHLQKAIDTSNTVATLQLDVHIPFPYNIGAMFTDIDKYLGKDYERALANLKKRCEGIIFKKYRGYEVMNADTIPVKYYIGIRQIAPLSDINKVYAEQFPKAQAKVLGEKLSLAGGPSGLFWAYDTIAGTADMAAAIPVLEQKKIAGGMGVFTIGGHRALIIEHFGPHELTGEAHAAMEEYMAEKSLRYIAPVIEEYVTGPSQEPDTSKWMTKIIYFIEGIKADSTLEKK